LWAQSVGSASDAPVQQDRPAQPPASAPESSKPETKRGGEEAHEASDPVVWRPAINLKPPPQPAVDDDAADAFCFESAADEEVAADVGRLVELDETTDSSDADESGEVPEFITDPMRSSTTLEEDKKKSQVLEMQMPGAVERRAEPREELQVKVPVVISRSQVRKTMPMKLILEIQIVDD
jgi:hypothetical protein